MRKRTGLTFYSLLDTFDKEEQETVIIFLRAAGAVVFGWERWEKIANTKMYELVYYVHPVFPHYLDDYFFPLDNLSK